MAPTRSFPFRCTGGADGAAASIAKVMPYFIEFLKVAFTNFHNPHCPAEPQIASLNLLAFGWRLGRSKARKGLTCLPQRTACIAAPAIPDRINGSHRVNSGRLAIPGLGLKS